MDDAIAALKRWFCVCGDSFQTGLTYFSDEALEYAR
jgi:hypothetical protein